MGSGRVIFSMWNFSAWACTSRWKAPWSCFIRTEYLSRLSGLYFLEAQTLARKMLPSRRLLKAQERDYWEGQVWKIFDFHIFSTPTRRQQEAQTWSSKGWSTKKNGPFSTFRPDLYKLEHRSKASTQANAYTVFWYFLSCKACHVYKWLTVSHERWQETKSDYKLKRNKVLKPKSKGQRNSWSNKDGNQPSARRYWNELYLGGFGFIDHQLVAVDDN